MALWVARTRQRRSAILSVWPGRVRARCGVVRRCPLACRPTGEGRAAIIAFAVDGTCAHLARYHLMAMANEEIISPTGAHFGSSRGPFRAGGRAQGPVIDQEGREIPPGSMRDGLRRFQFDFTHSSANPFGHLTRE